MSVNSLTIMTAMKDALINSGEFEKAQVCISEFVNVSRDAAAGGWLGIYKNRNEYDPNTLGVQASLNKWKFVGVYTIVVQFATYESGETCVTYLDTLVNKAVDIIFSDVTIAGVVDLIKRVDVNYSFVPDFESDEGDDEVYFQQAMIDVELEVDRR